MTQRQIEQAHRRSLKTKYSHLTPVEKRLIKLRETEAMLEKSFMQQWAYISKRQPPPYDPETTPEDILDMIDLTEVWRKKLVRIRKSKDRLIEKHGLDEDKIAHIHMLSNIAPGGSY